MSAIEKISNANKFINKIFGETPRIGIVLGSGLGDFVKSLKVLAEISYDDIPGFPAPTVEGHNGKLVFAKVGKNLTVIMQGRVHFYEGHPLADVVFPIRVLCSLGIENLILTNAAGGILPGMQPADLMIIEDHINMTGHNPLMGPNIKDLGPRFPDMTEAYDRGLIKKLEASFKNQGLKPHKGVYCWMTGPSYETPAEIRHLKIIGGGAVGMSTVPEAIVAHHMGVKVAGISCITNLAAGISPEKLNHDEVTENAGKAAKNFSNVLSDFISNL
jgi:purine-nucleoside phosphorylase